MYSTIVCFINCCIEFNRKLDYQIKISTLRLLRSVVKICAPFNSIPALPAFAAAHWWVRHQIKKPKFNFWLFIIICLIFYVNLKYNCIVHTDSDKQVEITVNIDNVHTIIRGTFLDKVLMSKVPA